MGEDMMILSSLYSTQHLFQYEVVQDRKWTAWSGNYCEIFHSLYN